MSAATACITGVAGFLGSRLAARLLADGFAVTGLDNLSHGVRDRLAPLAARPAFTFVEGDVRDPAAMARAAAGARHLLHFAEVKIPRFGGALETLEVNLEGTEQALEAARREGARFVFGSTDEVYGKNPDETLHEESALVMGRTDSRRWSYGTSKLMGEQLALAFADEHQVPVSILRYFGLYGPGQSAGLGGGPQSIFVAAALAGEVLPIHGDGLQVRTFTHIDDAVEGTRLAMESEYPRGEILNIAGTEHISIINLAYMVWRLSGRRDKPRLEFVPYTDFSAHYEDVPRRVADIAKARYLLGFNPRISMEAGFAETVRAAPRHPEPSL
ncbi:MAG: NAD-dependent epimerase/dehydratase family protein [Kiritimatiellae bacterium]|nr:NAD-dependent epimerase/dehydratase family protein [Kiritimatiellia bacterium]